MSIFCRCQVRCSRSIVSPHPPARYGGCGGCGGCGTMHTGMIPIKNESDIAPLVWCYAGIVQARNTLLFTASHSSYCCRRRRVRGASRPRCRSPRGTSSTPSGGRPCPRGRSGTSQSSTVHIPSSVPVPVPLPPQHHTGNKRTLMRVRPRMPAFWPLSHL